MVCWVCFKVLYALSVAEFVMLMSDLITTLFMDELTMIADGIDSSMANTQANDVFHTRATHYTPHYQVSLSLINGASATTEVDWSIEEAVQGISSRRSYPFSCLINNL